MKGINVLVYFERFKYNLYLLVENFEIMFKENMYRITRT